MFKIGEFSKLTQVSIRMLRYYDETGLLHPAEIDPFTNYRLYSAAQIPALNRILFLRDLGLKVSEIAETLHSWDAQSIETRLDTRRSEIKRAIQAQQQQLMKIKQAKQDLRKKSIAIHCNVTIKDIPAYPVFSLRRIVPNYFAEGELWQEMSACAKRSGVPLSGNCFAIYHDTEYKENDVDIEICSIIDAPVKAPGTSPDGLACRMTEPVPLMACMMVTGPFTNIARAFLSFANWLQTHNQYRMHWQDRQIVHRGPCEEADPAHYLTEIQIPLESR